MSACARTFPGQRIDKARRIKTLTTMTQRSPTPNWQAKAPKTHGILPKKRRKSALFARFVACLPSIPRGGILCLFALFAEAVASRRGRIRAPIQGHHGMGANRRCLLSGVEGFWTVKLMVFRGSMELTCPAPTAQSSRRRWALRGIRVPSFISTRDRRNSHEARLVAAIQEKPPSHTDQYRLHRSHNDCDDCVRGHRWKAAHLDK